MKEKEEKEKKEEREKKDCGMVGLKEKLKRNFCGEVISATTIQQAATKQTKKQKKKLRFQEIMESTVLWNRRSDTV